jgi:ketosteroid isomerase-like protein
MRRSLFLIPVALAVFWFSCAPPAPDVAQVRKTIEGMTAQMQQEMETGTMDTTMARYVENPISMPNFGPMLTGRTAIKDYFRRMQAMGMTMKDVDFTVTDVQVGGPYAYEVGTYKMTVTMPGMGEIPDEGKYLTVWEKVPDGSWKIKIETWNTNMQPPMPGIE